jgi:hypothetical protein
MGYVLISVHTDSIIPVVVHKTGTYTWGISVRTILPGFRRFEGGLFDDRNRKTKNRNG